MILPRCFLVLSASLSVLAACLPACAATQWQRAVDQLVTESRGPSYNQYDLTAKQLDLLRNMEEEEDHLEAVISMGLHNGRLSDDQAAHFRGELNRISELKSDAAQDKQLSYPEAKQLIDLAENVMKELTQSYESGKPTATFTASIPYPLYEQDLHRDTILNKILQAKNTGVMSDATFSSLREQLDVTTAKMDKMREKTGYLSLADRQILNGDLKQLDELVSSSLQK